MRKYSDKMVTTNELTEVICDCCGKTIHVDDFVEFQEMLRIEFTGGYGAIVGDGSTYTADLCQACVVKVLGPYLQKVSDACD